MFTMEGDDDPVHLAPPFASIDPLNIEDLRTAVLQLLLHPSNSPALLDVDVDEGSRASDFVRVATWSLAQDPYRMAAWDQSKALSEASEQGIALFYGDGRWPAFREWAYFVGLGMPTLHGFVMSPARAIREALRSGELHKQTPTNADVPLATFLQNLAADVPVLDGGTYRNEIDAQLRAKGYILDDHAVSPSLALALLQLNDEEEILLSDRGGDVAARFSLLGRAGVVVRIVSHIRRGSGGRVRGSGPRAKAQA